MTKNNVCGAPNHLSEVFRIVEGATRGDKDKVRNYALLLAEKLEADGEANSAKWLRQIAEGNAGARIVARQSNGAPERAEEEMRRQRDELSEEMERCHRLLDVHWGLSLETTALDTLEDRLKMLLAEIQNNVAEAKP